MKLPFLLVLFSLSAEAGPFVVCDGNSITKGFGATAGSNYPTVLNIILPSLVVSNQGITGDLAANNTSANRTITNFDAHVAYAPLVSIHLEGINDIAQNDSSLNVTNYLGQWIRSVRATYPNAKLLGATLIDANLGSDTLSNRVREVNVWVRTNGNYDFVVDLRSDSRLATWWNTTYFQADGVHPTDAGYEVIAQIVAQALITNNLAAATYYVDSVTGSDANTSAQAMSRSTPWAHAPGMSGATGNAASYSTQPGDVFILKGGSKWTFADTSSDLLTVPASSLTYRGGQQLQVPWGTGYPMLDGTGSVNTRSGVISQNKTNCVVDGLLLTNLFILDGGNGVSIGGGLVNDWVVENCYIVDCGANMIGVGVSSSGSNITIAGCTFLKGGRVFMGVDSGIDFKTVNIYSNVFLGPQTYNANNIHCDGIMIGCSGSDNPSRFQYIYIHHNRFLGDWSQGATALVYLNNFAGSGSATTGGGYHCQIYDNQLCLDSNGLLSNGFIFCANGWRDVQIYNNTINSVTSGNTQSGITVFNVPSGAEYTMKNNIISGVKYGISAADLTSSSLIVDYNVYQTINGTFLVGDSVGWSDTIAAARSKGYEAHGLAADPLFMSIPNGTTGVGNWMLQSNSPAIGAGVNLASLFTDDLNHTNRPASAAWTIGAFEGGSGGSPAQPPAGGTVSVGSGVSFGAGVKSL